MTFSRRTFKTVESFSFTERLPSQREMKRLCEITPDSSGWACGIGIAKIFSALIFRVPKLQSLNLPIMDFLFWKLWYTVVLSTGQDVCFWKKPGMVPFGQGNVGKRSREEIIMRKRTIAHFCQIWYSVGAACNHDSTARQNGKQHKNLLLQGKVRSHTIFWWLRRSHHILLGEATFCEETTFYKYTWVQMS